MRLPKASSKCAPEARAGIMNWQPSAQHWGRVRSDTNQPLHFPGEKTKLAVLYKCQVAQSLTQASLSAPVFPRHQYSLFFAFLSINSFTVNLRQRAGISTSVFLGESVPLAAVPFSKTAPNENAGKGFGELLVRGQGSESFQ